VADRAHRRIAVLTLLDSLRPGGAERLAVNVTCALDRSRFRPILCVSRAGLWSPLADRLAAADVPVVTLPRRSRGAVWAWAALVAVLRRERIDVIHAHMFGSNVWGTLLGRLARTPVVIAHEHSWSFEGQPIRNFLDGRVVARGADVFVAVTREDRRRMIELEGIPAESIRVVPNGIPPVPRASSDLRAELAIPPEAPVIGTLGVLRPEKRLDLLLDATAVLASRISDLHVIVAGQGREEPELRAATLRAGLTDTVHFVGFRPNVADVLAALDVAVFPSDREGAPLAVLEAMATGIPVVASRVGGLPEVIADGVHGLLVPRRDPEAIAAAVGRLLDDEGLRTRLGRAAQARQQTLYTVEASVARLEQLYEELYRTSSRARRGV
jgi:glycosyltransferase involved in cell wall biosynthesis